MSALTDTEGLMGTVFGVVNPSDPNEDFAFHSANPNPDFRSTESFLKKRFMKSLNLNPDLRIWDRRRSFRRGF